MWKNTDDFATKAGFKGKGQFWQFLADPKLSDYKVKNNRNVSGNRYLVR